MKLIIQIPAYNEETTLEATIGDLPRELDGIDSVEYLIIDDGSTDATIEVARDLGVQHIVRHKKNRGLAAAFMTGLDACLRLGADIIVNTDADNQYKGDDISRLIAPILEGEADVVVGERSIDETEHFSAQKKRFQKIGSFVVRVASGTDVPDAPSGFRAYTRHAAMRINVINQYTYTLETIIQAGMHDVAITSVPIRTNPETRKSRLFKSMWAYMRRSASVIVRSVMMYRPLKFFTVVGAVFLAIGLIFIIRFLVIAYISSPAGHLQSLILAAALIVIGIQSIIAGLQADIIAANRKILEDVQQKVRELYYGDSEDHSDL